jgi:thiamine biosynthesis lipoprotein
VFWNRPLALFLLAFVAILAWWQSRPSDQVLHRTQFLMGTIVEVKAFASSSAGLDAAMDAAFAEMARLDQLLSRYQRGSDVERINNAEASIDVAPETEAVLRLGLDVSKKSQGAFDLSLGRLKKLWGFDQEHPHVPSSEAVHEALKGIGPEALDLGGSQLRKRHPDLSVDFGGIAKGYIVDQAIDVLKRHGVESASVNAGGDMYLLGYHQDRPWRIGIQHPRHPNQTLDILSVHDRAVVTSGDYEQFFVEDGTRYHHLLDPQTGYPAGSSQSVTVVADSVALADALATALFVLGPDKGRGMLASYPDAVALWVDATGQLLASEGFNAYRLDP